MTGPSLNEQNLTIGALKKKNGGEDIPATWDYFFKAAHESRLRFLPEKISSCLKRRDNEKTHLTGIHFTDIINSGL